MKDIAYQQKAIRELSDKIIDLLDNEDTRQKIVFKAPTGSGKTYMTAMSMELVADTLKDETRHQYNRVAFVWIAPNRLHSQAYETLSGLFAETQSLRPVMFGNINDGKLNHGDVLCLNWGSIHSNNNIFVRDSENGDSLWDIIDSTVSDNTVIVAVIDEEHLHWDARADRAAAVLAKLRAAVEVRVSATPKTVSLHNVIVRRKSVVEAQMIKEGIVINPDIKVSDRQDAEEYLIDEAIGKRDMLAQCYSEMGKTINPLLLIQLPNDGATISSEDKTMRDMVVSHLRKKGITTGSGELAVWLSDSADKINLDGIEKLNSPVKVLLFKEAIAKGWDCPRAAVLLIFRKLQSNEFAIQTLGRILRMPEQKHYFNPLLNMGYVYTNLSKNRIIVAGETEDYWKQELIRSYRRENLNNVKLPSVYEFYAASDRNRLGSDFTQFLLEFIRKHWLMNSVPPSIFSIDREGNMTIPESLTGRNEDTVSNRHLLETFLRIRLNVRGVTITIPKDLKIQNEETEIKVEDSVEYTRSNDKVHRIFTDYCRSLLKKYEKAAGTPILAAAVIEVMERLFGLPEWQTTRVVLSEHPSDNKSKFTDILTRALDGYYPRVCRRKALAKERSLTPWTWEVPEYRVYNSDNNSQRNDIYNHALIPFVETNQNRLQEHDFATFLDAHKESVDWWYKNGDEGRIHYAIEYYNPEQRAKKPFYVDFIIRLNNGDIYLFDTKGSTDGGNIESDEVLVAKHNALNEYVANSTDPNLKAGSLIRRSGNSSNLWMFCRQKIDTADVGPEWETFFPDMLV